MIKKDIEIEFTHKFLAVARVNGKWFHAPAHVAFFAIIGPQGFAGWVSMADARDLLDAQGILELFPVEYILDTDLEDYGTIRDSVLSASLQCGQDAFGD